MVRGFKSVWGFLFVLVLFSGCGRHHAASAANDLKEVGIMYLSYVSDHQGGAPTKPDDFAAMAKDFPKGFEGLKDGQYELVWGAKVPANASATVLGHEKDVPTKGGLVLFADGSVKSLTAQEFQAAPKAKGNE